MHEVNDGIQVDVSEARQRESEAVLFLWVSRRHGTLNLDLLTLHLAPYLELIQQLQQRCITELVLYSLVVADRVR